MPKDNKYNPIAYTEGFILLAIIVIAVVSSVVLEILNYFHLL